MLLKKIKTILKLLKNGNYEFFFYLIKKKLFLSDEPFVPRKKINLLNEHYNYFKNGIVRTNFYKNSVFKYYAISEKSAITSKILGYYEIEIQKEIIKLQKKHKINSFVQFGVADGYHLIGLANNSIFEKYIAFDNSLNSIKLFKQNLKNNKKIKKLKIFLKKASFSTIKKYASNNEKFIFLIDIEGDEKNILIEENVKYFRNSILLIEIHFWKKKERKQILNFLLKYFKVRIISSQNKKILYKNLDKKITSKFNKKELHTLLDDGRPNNMVYFSCVPINMVNDKK